MINDLIRPYTIKKILSILALIRVGEGDYCCSI